MTMFLAYITAPRYCLVAGAECALISHVKSSNKTETVLLQSNKTETVLLQ